MKSTHKFNLERFEDYRIGSDRNIYKLPYTDAKGNKRGLKKIKVTKNGRYVFFLEERETWSRKQLTPFIIVDPNPIELK